VSRFIFFVVLSLFTQHIAAAPKTDTVVLKWALSFYGSWDNQPQFDVGTTPDLVSISDYGVNTALSYDF